MLHFTFLLDDGYCGPHYKDVKGKSHYTHAHKAMSVFKPPITSLWLIHSTRSKCIVQCNFILGKIGGGQESGGLKKQDIQPSIAFVHCTRKL